MLWYIENSKENQRFYMISKQLKHQDPDRYLTTIFAKNKIQHDQLITLYSFNLELAQIRERVNEPIAGMVRLQWWHDIFDKKRLTTRDHELLPHLKDMILDTTHLHTIISARENDLSPTPFTTETELLTYCEETSSTLLYLAYTLLTKEPLSPKHKQQLSHLGKAWALCGLLRAHHFFNQQQWLYIPTNWLNQQQLSPEDVFTNNKQEKILPLLQKILQHAKYEISQSQKLPKSLKPISLYLPLTQIYLKKIIRKKGDVINHPITASPLTKIMTAIMH